MKTHARQGGQARQATRKANAGAHLESLSPPDARAPRSFWSLLSGARDPAASSRPGLVTTQTKDRRQGPSRPAAATFHAASPRPGVVMTKTEDRRRRPGRPGAASPLETLWTPGAGQARTRVSAAGDSGRPEAQPDQEGKKNWPTQSQSRGSGQQRSQIMKTHARQGGQARQVTRKANAGAHLESPEPPRRASPPELLEPSERRQRPGSKLQAWTSHDPNPRPAPGTQQARGSYGFHAASPRPGLVMTKNRRAAPKTRQARGRYRFHAGKLQAWTSHDLHPRPAPKTRQARQPRPVGI